MEKVEFQPNRLPREGLGSRKNRRNFCCSSSMFYNLASWTKTNEIRLETPSNSIFKGPSILFELRSLPKLKGLSYFEWHKGSDDGGLNHGENWLSPVFRNLARRTKTYEISSLLTIISFPCFVPSLFVTKYQVNPMVYTLWYIITF